jgi:hypothetical protein
MLSYWKAFCGIHYSHYLVKRVASRVIVSGENVENEQRNLS